MGRSSQRKGRNAELELCRILQGYGVPAQAGQALNFGTVPDVTGIKGVHAECKRVEKLNLVSALNQAANDSEKFRDGIPCVFHRRNREEWVVSMRLNDWVQLYQHYADDLTKFKFSCFQIPAKLYETYQKILF